MFKKEKQMQREKRGGGEEMKMKFQEFLLSTSFLHNLGEERLSGL